MPSVPPLPPAPPDPRLSLDVLTPAARAWLDEAVARVAAEPSAIRALFPAARRHCGRASLNEHWSTDEAARAVLLTSLPLRGKALADEVADLYRHGDPAEQRAVLRALPLLDDLDDLDDLAADGSHGSYGELTLSLVREALRANDTRVIEAALGPYAAARLPQPEYRQAVLKCVFLDLPLTRVTGIDARADHELVRMLADFAHERIAAGRTVPTDVWPLVRRFPDIADTLATRARSLAPTRPEAVARALAALGEGPAGTPPQEEV
ncbi:EboA domain-containing protein [Streptomyces sp. NPDC005648]|uniref:EboA domain-containing protein n=1 Tax=Streptomyces sp. NPDC005648 TaxID=3157044 RepID=UPI0033B98941